MIKLNIRSSPPVLFRMHRDRDGGDGGCERDRRAVIIRVRAAAHKRELDVEAR